MEIVTSLTRKELEQIITDSISKCLNDKLPPSQLEPSDRCALEDACIITGLSKASIYKMTHEKKIPYAKFGSHLVFSRRQLAAWVESHTLPPSSPEDELKDNLIKSAEKKLRNEI
jgi:excisionase family DNA binding protein